MAVSTFRIDSECEQVRGWWQELGKRQSQKTKTVIWSRPKVVLYIQIGGDLGALGCLTWLCDIGQHPVLGAHLCHSLSDGLNGTNFWKTIEKLWEGGGLPGRELAKRAATLKRSKVRGKIGWSIALAVLGPILVVVELLRLTLFREKGGVMMVAEPILMLGGGAFCLVFAAILFATACTDYWRSREYLTANGD
jgi:hypothetical protein